MRSTHERIHPVARAWDEAESIKSWSIIASENFEGGRTGIRGLHAARSGKTAGPLCLVLLALLLEGCTPPSVHEPVTLTLLEEWTNKTFNEGRQQELQQFTRDTGIRVKLLPSPESAREKLALWQELLGTGASGPDVYGIDVIWPGILHDSLLDLRPHFAREMSAQFPAIAASYTVGHKVVAVPYRADIGLLFYRTDLLREYGYREPPRTWDELEKMAARIQAGERAKGQKEFWGFVWQGAAAEALTCNALEWQAAEGGGQIIEEDTTISVNNPHAIRSWQRAARWVGSISPPSVVAYQEWDALNMWVGGAAAFMRGWPTAYVDSQAWVRQHETSSRSPCCLVVREAASGPWEEPAWPFRDSRSSR